MPFSISDFCSRVNAATPASGARFSAQVNNDGSVAIYRKATAATAGLTLTYSRIVYGVHNNAVVIGDGSGQTAQTALAFIAALT